MTDQMENRGVELPASEQREKKKKAKKRKKMIKRIIITLIVLVILGIGAYYLHTLLASSGEQKQEQLLTDFVSRGSIVSMVEGEASAVPKNSATVTLTSAGDVVEVYVTEGDVVSAGTPLFSIRNTELAELATEEQKTVDNYKKQLNALYDAKKELDIHAEYDGKLMNVEHLNAGDYLMKGSRVATLVDDTRMLLSLYFSYAYEKDIAVGQNATISLPASMAQLPGTVREIHKVERISQEGAKLFEVVLEMKNPGTLTRDMAATATLSAGAEPIYPYEPGTLDYFRTTEITAKTGGEISSFTLFDYSSVKAGQLLVSLKEDENDVEIAAMENQLKAAQKSLDETRQSLAALHGVAPIDGTVLSVGIRPGEEAKAGTAAVSIADMQTMMLNTFVDEMNVSNVHVGMEVNLDLWGTPLIGVIENLSLSANTESGVARFPMTITVDNADGTLLSGSYVHYSFLAGQSEECLLVPIQCVKYVSTEEGTQRALFVRAEEAPEGALSIQQEASDIPEGFYPVAVETGISDSNNIEILSGVEEGAEVFTGRVISEMW